MSNPAEQDPEIEAMKAAVAELRKRFPENGVVLSKTITVANWRIGARPTVVEPAIYRIHIIDRGSVENHDSLEATIGDIHEKLSPRSRLAEADRLEIEARKIREEVFNGH